MKKKKNKVTNLIKDIEFNKRLQSGISRDHILCLGLLVKTLGENYKDFILQVNSFLLGQNNFDFIVYQDYPSRLEVSPLFGIMNTGEFYGHYGPVLVDTLEKAILLDKAAIWGSKYYYILGPEWELFPETDFSTLYKSERLNLISSSPELSTKIKDKFDITVNRVALNYDFKQLVPIIGRENFAKSPSYTLSV